MRLFKKKRKFNGFTEIKQSRRKDDMWQDYMDEILEKNLGHTGNINKFFKTNYHSLNE